MHDADYVASMGSLGHGEWRQRITVGVATALRQPVDAPRAFVASLKDDVAGVTTSEWSGLPARVVSCLGRKKALALLDWEGDDLALSGRLMQEEYLEWRVLRDAGGEVTRVELTTEMPDYWRVLAAYEPALLLETMAEFSREDSVPAEVAYGALDPFARGVRAEDREWAFALTMLPPAGRSPYNSGRKAICCMAQQSNTLEGLVHLAAASACRRAIKDESDGRLRPLTSAEMIPRLDRAAVAGRNSDPVIVDRLSRLAFEGQEIALEDPASVYIQGVESTRLRTPNGHVVPREWFTFSRGVLPTNCEEVRFQRLCVEVPSSEGFVLGDLVDCATEQSISYGGQIAELVQLGVHFEVAAPAEPLADPVIVPAVAAESPWCTDIREHFARHSGTSPET